MTDKAEWAAAQARAAAWMDTMHDLQGQLDGKQQNPVERARERYATGKITLGQLEVEVSAALAEKDWL
jgi:hypothetical protein